MKTNKIKLKIKKGDKVEVLLGKDRSRQGVVRKVFPIQGSALIEGINIVKKHVKARGKDHPGGILEVEKPLAISKLAVICPNCKKPTRIGFRVEKDSKYRICKKCNELVDGGKDASK